MLRQTWVPKKKKKTVKKQNLSRAVRFLLHSCSWSAWNEAGWLSVNWYVFVYLFIWFWWDLFIYPLNSSIGVSNRRITECRVSVSSLLLYSSGDSPSCHLWVLPELSPVGTPRGVTNHAVTTQRSVKRLTCSRLVFSVRTADRARPHHPESSTPLPVLSVSCREENLTVIMYLGRNNLDYLLSNLE